MSTIAVKKVKLGDNADTSKNFLIEVPAVADGTLTIKRESGAPVLSIAADGTINFPGPDSARNRMTTPVNIGESANLNNVPKTTGVYFGFEASANAPGGYGGIYVLEVLVYSQDWLVQRFTAIGGDGTTSTHVRSFNNATAWSAWAQL